MQAMLPHKIHIDVYVCALCSASVQPVYYTMSRLGLVHTLFPCMVSTLFPCYDIGMNNTVGKMHAQSCSIVYRCDELKISIELQATKCRKVHTMYLNAITHMHNSALCHALHIRTVQCAWL